MGIFGFESMPSGNPDLIHKAENPVATTVDFVNACIVFNC
jgi:hypothetical protein